MVFQNRELYLAYNVIEIFSGKMTAKIQPALISVFAPINGLSSSCYKSIQVDRGRREDSTFHLIITCKD